jgi:hypothetical protein
MYGAEADRAKGVEPNYESTQSAVIIMGASEAAFAIPNLISPPHFVSAQTKKPHIFHMHILGIPRKASQKVTSTCMSFGITNGRMRNRQAFSGPSVLGDSYTEVGKIKIVESVSTWQRCNRVLSGDRMAIPNMVFSFGT